MTRGSNSDRPGAGLWVLAAVVAGTLLILQVIRLTPPVGPIQQLSALFVLLLYWGWVPAFVTACFLFFALGRTVHRRTGLPVFRPYSGTIVMGLLLVSWIVVATEWGWSRTWSWNAAAFVLTGLAFAAGCCTGGWWAYTEMWGSLFGDRVAGVVARSVLAGRFTHDNHQSPWGSLHCLDALQRLHRDTDVHVHRVFESDALRHETKATVLSFEKASDSLYMYLGWQWAPELLPESARAEQKTEIVRLMMTVAVLFHERLGQDAEVLMAKWRTRLDQVPNTAYTEYLRLIFDVGSGRCPLPTEQILHKTLDVFSAVDSEEKKDICACTWLALAPGRLDSQAALDVWIEMREWMGKDVVFHERSDLLAAAASESLLESYRIWKDRTPEAWNAGLEGRVSFLTACRG